MRTSTGYTLWMFVTPLSLFVVAPAGEYLHAYTMPLSRALTISSGVVRSVR